MKIPYLGPHFFKCKTTPELDWQVMVYEFSCSLYINPQNTYGHNHSEAGRG